MLKLHPDGYLIFPDKRVLPLAFFQRLEPDFALPVEPTLMVGMEYETGSRLVYYDAKGNAYSQEETVSPSLEAILAAQEAYFRIYAREQNPPRSKRAARAAAKEALTHARLQDIVKPTISGTLEADQINSIVQALVALGLVEDTR